MSTTYGRSAVAQAVQTVLEALKEGRPVDGGDERQIVDLKEEHGRRDPSGAIGPSRPKNENAAAALAAAAACMANTPGGGALIIGVSDTGALIGTDLEVDWLRHRLWELSGKAMTVDVEISEVRGARLLVITVPQALEPIRVAGRIRWRVGTNCVDVDPHTWHDRRLAVLHHDWSADSSTVPVAEVRPTALQHARELLIASGEPHATELATGSDQDLLRRLNVVTHDGYLTNAGVIAFVGRGDPCLDYIRRAHVGGDSLSRIRRAGRSLLEELAEVFAAFEATIPTVHVQEGLAIGQHREIPLRSAREAVVNGVAHREWVVKDPTVVEHVGGILRVTSPGGFVGGVTPDNIITHPSTSRNRALAELLSVLRIAEREGIGVDRMMGDMVRRGNPRPEILQIPGPSVRTTLIGDDVDQAWVAFLNRLRPAGAGEDLNALLLLRHLTEQVWVDPLTAAGLIQDTVATAGSALIRLFEITVDADPVIVPLPGVPDTADAVWVLSDAAAARLKEGRRASGRPSRAVTREDIARRYVQARGRISSTELAGLVRADPTNMGAILRTLEDQGMVEPSWPSRRGAGFHYVLSRPVDQGG